MLGRQENTGEKIFAVTKALAGGRTRCGTDVEEPVVDTRKDTVHCDKRESGVLLSRNFQHKLLN